MLYAQETLMACKAIKDNGIDLHKIESTLWSQNKTDGPLIKSLKQVILSVVTLSTSIVRTLTARQTTNVLIMIKIFNVFKKNYNTNK